MNRNEKTPPAKKPHSLALDNNVKLNISGILSMDGYGYKQIIATLSENKLIIDGSGLSVDRLDIDEGSLLISGLVTGIRYAKAAEKGGLFKKLIK